VVSDKLAWYRFKYGGGKEKAEAAHNAAQLQREMQARAAVDGQQEQQVAASEGQDGKGGGKGQERSASHRLSRSERH